MSEMLETVECATVNKTQDLLSSQTSIREAVGSFLYYVRG